MNDPPEYESDQARPLGYETPRRSRSFGRRYPIVWNVVCVVILLVAIGTPLTLLFGLLSVAGLTSGELSFHGRAMRTPLEKAAWIAAVALISGASIWFVVTQMREPDP